MDNEERWDAAVEMFLTLEKNYAFFARSGDGATEQWVVIYPNRYEDGSKTIYIENVSSSDRKTLSLEEFVDVVVLPPPEPEKSEAEKLFETVELCGRIFSTDSAGCATEFVCHSITFSCGPKRRVSVTLNSLAGNAGVRTETLSRREFIVRGFTATHPKTEREVELESQVEELEEDNTLLRAFNSGDIAAVKQAESRVKELESTIADCNEMHTRRGNSLSDKNSELVIAKLRIKELEIENKDLKKTIQDVAYDISHHLDSEEEDT